MFYILPCVPCARWTYLCEWVIEHIQPLPLAHGYWLLSFDRHSMSIRSFVYGEFTSQHSTVLCIPSLRKMCNKMIHNFACTTCIRSPSILFIFFFCFPFVPARDISTAPLWAFPSLGSEKGPFCVGWCVCVAHEMYSKELGTTST